VPSIRDVVGGVVGVFDTIPGILYSSKLGYLYLKLDERYIIFISFTVGIFNLEPQWGHTPPYRLMTSLGVGIP